MTTSSSVTPARQPGTTRLSYLDNLRSALTVLVVLHHVALSYSTFGLWYYNEPGRDASAGLLDAFVVLNQTWFMGAFFLIAGYLTPDSLQRKGIRTYLRDRLVRLGVPLVVFVVALQPLINGMSFAPQHWELGPMWFVAVLLVFSLIYAAVSANSRRCVIPESTLPIGLAVVGLLVALTVLAYLGRIWVPSGTRLLGLPTPDFLPQYAVLFAAGVLAHRHGWAARLTARAGWVALVVAVLATIAAGPVLTAAIERVAGYGTVESLLAAAWQAVFACGVIVAMLVLFRLRINGAGRVSRNLATNAYAVYVLHPLVLVPLGYLLSSFEAPAVLKFAVLAAVGVALCWLLAAAVRRIPRVSEIV